MSGPADGPILLAPLSQTECVWYRIGAESWQVHGDAHHWRQVVGLQRGSLRVGEVEVSVDLVQPELTVLEEVRVLKQPSPQEAPMLHRLAALGHVPPDELARKANAFDTLAWKVTEHVIRPGQPIEATGVLRRGRLRKPLWRR
ncbi:hypothetical protein [Allorhizocola rhizosphaerae]|uniref:hypothetical protein n=1 Tax=Allorhizocola rhizosphaerae TaxID=1872709 RepID=UPI000E3B8D84|nr:hypothetical protein [Allorhizocola rhizosphaerae]